MFPVDFGELLASASLLAAVGVACFFPSASFLAAVVCVSYIPEVLSNLFASLAYLLRRCLVSRD
jgi:hypothetical protein